MAHGITVLAAKHVNRASCSEGRWPEKFLMCNLEQVNASFEAITDVLVAGILQAAKKVLAIINSALNYY